MRPNYVWVALKWLVLFPILTSLNVDRANRFANYCNGLHDIEQRFG